MHGAQGHVKKEKCFGNISYNGQGFKRQDKRRNDGLQEGSSGNRRGYGKGHRLSASEGLAKALKRSGREASEGMVHAYIHGGGRIGVLVEVNCETDFAAKSEDFLEFAKNLAMHIAAANPLGVQEEDIPEEIVERERAIYMAQARETGKPENILDKMVDGKMRKFYRRIRSPGAGLYVKIRTRPFRTISMNWLPRSVRRLSFAGLPGTSSVNRIAHLGFRMLDLGWRIGDCGSFGGGNGACRLSPNLPVADNLNGLYQ